MKISLFLAFILISCTFAKKYKPRIVGGYFAKENQFPYQIAIYKEGSFICGGSIFNEDWIITAAHCVLDGNDVDDTLSIRAGSLSIKSGGVTRNVIKSFYHESYGNFENDFALMRLDESLEFSEAIQPIEIETEELKPNTEVTISGWGTEFTGGFSPTYLKFNKLKILEGSECGCPDNDSALCSNGTLCLGHTVNNGACNGDSGGPAVADNKLVGVANFVVGGCGSSNPDGYAKVSYFQDWILDTIENYENSKISFL